MIVVTDEAISRILSLSASTNKSPEILVDIKRSGCSGLSYTFAWTDDGSSELLKYDDKGVKIYLSVQAQSVLDGATLTVVKTDLTEKFEWDNPNETARCGCGTSFQV